MKFYRIKDWATLYENNRSRRVTDLSWVPIPNRHDGECYSLIMAHPRSSEIFTAWILMLQVASRCHPRGILVRDNGNAHTAETLAIKTRGKREWFELALEFLIAETDWLQVSDIADEAPERHPGDIEVTSWCDRGDEEQKGTEWNGMEEREASPPAPKPQPEPEKPKRFIKPTLDEVRLAADKAGLPPQEAEKFFNYYESVGWKIGGKAPMKSLPHAIATWKVRFEERGGAAGHRQGPAPLFDLRTKLKSLEEVAVSHPGNRESLKYSGKPADIESYTDLRRKIGDLHKQIAAQ